MDELNGLRNGVQMSTSFSPVPLRVVAALPCAAADIPATRKVCGFVGHSANKACSKCLNFLPGGFQEERDFSGFQRRNCEKLKAAKSQSEYDRLSRLYGVHYSALCKLNYFDCVCFHVTKDLIIINNKSIIIKLSFQ